MKLLGHPLARARPGARRRDADARPSGWPRALMLQAAYGLESPPTGADGGARPARARGGASRSRGDLDALGGARPASRGREQVVCDAGARDGAAQPGRRAGPRRRARPRAGPHAPLRGRVRPRARGGLVPAPQRRDAVPPGRERRRLDEAGRRPPARAARPARARPLPLLHRVHARPAAARRSSARRRPTTGGRARRARSGTRCARCFAPDEVARLTRARKLAELTWSRRPRARASASGSAPRRVLGADGARRGARARPRERLGAAHRPRARRARPADRALDRRRSRAARASRAASPSPSSRPSGRAPPCGSSTAWSIRARSTPSSTRASAGASPTRRSTASTPGCPSASAPTRWTPSRLDETIEFMRECLAEAIEGQVRLDLSELDRLELEGTLGRDLERFVRQEVEIGSPLVPRRFEVSFGTQGAPVELQRGLDLGGFTGLREDRPDRPRPDERARDRPGLQVRRAAPTRRGRSTTEGKLQVPLYVLALRDLVGIEPLGGLYRALAGSREARGLVLASADDVVPGVKDAGLPRRRRVLGARRPRRRARAGGGRAHARGRRAPRPARRHVPDLVRPLADVPGEARMSVRAPNPEQQAAIDEAGVVFVSAGAGTGQDDGARRALRARGRRPRPLARERPRHHLHGARGRRAARPDPRAARSSSTGPTWRATSTAPGSRPSTASATGCSRAIRSRRGSTPASASSTRASRACCARRRSPRRSRASAPGASPSGSRCSRPTGRGGSRVMLGGVYERLRSAGRAARARRVGDGLASVARGARRVRRVTLERSRRSPHAPTSGRSSWPPGRPPRGRRAARPRRPAPGRADESLVLVPTRRSTRSRAPRSTRSPRATASCSQELLARIRRGVPRGEGARVRRRLRGSPALRPRPAPRRARRCASGRSGASAPCSWTSSRTRTGSSASSWTRSTREELFFVGDEFQSIYRFRHADVEVFRERRAQSARRARADAELPLAPRDPRAS